MHRRHRAPPLVILGASTRSVAESAARAGWAVHAADLFCDLDLQAIAHEAVAVDAPAAGRYPWSLATAAKAFPPSAAWCYTGGLENHPDLIEAIAAVRPLVGNAADVVRHVRDPWRVAAAVRAVGIAFPETRADPSAVPADGTFLVKPLAAAGGTGIRRWRGPAACRRAAAPEGSLPHAAGRHPARVWQRFVAGEPLSACYRMERGSSRLIGVSRQFVGAAWCHALPFAWCGGATLGRPDRSAPRRLRARLERLGELLAGEFATRGLVGIDLVATPCGGLTLIEVNPRPTASMELFERLGRMSVALDHLTAGGLPPPAGSSPGPRRHAAWAKAVLFVPRATVVTETLIESLRATAAPWTEADGGWPAIADVPRPGQTLRAAAPALTVFAGGDTEREASRLLRARTQCLDAVLTAARRGDVQPAIRRACCCSTNSAGST